MLDYIDPSINYTQFDLNDPLDRKHLEALANDVIPALRAALEQPVAEIASEIEGEYSWPQDYNRVVAAERLLKSLAIYLLENSCQQDGGWTADPMLALDTDCVHQWIERNTLQSAEEMLPLP